MDGWMDRGVDVKLGPWIRLEESRVMYCQSKRLVTSGKDLCLGL